MKKIYLLALPALLFSFEINFNKKFSQSLIQDTLTTNLSVVVNDENEKKINTILEKFNKKIKESNKVEKDLGSLSIRPVYRSSSNVPKITGYRGELRYKVNADKARKINNFISELIELKDDRDTNIIINNLRWTVKEEEYIKAQDELRLSSIIWVSNYTKELSSTFNKDCSVKNINIHTNSYRPLAKMSFNSESANTKIAVPQSNKEEVSITPSFTLECK